MIKKLATPLALVIAVFGLTILATEQASATNRTGTHNVQVACDANFDGVDESFVRAQYSLTYAGSDGSVSIYTFQLNRQSYFSQMYGLKGPDTSGNGGVNSTITFKQQATGGPSNLSLSLRGGPNSGSGAIVLAPGAPTRGTSGNYEIEEVNGVSAPVAWNPVEIRQNAGGMDNWVRFVWKVRVTPPGGGTVTLVQCSEQFNLGLQNSPLFKSGMGASTTIGCDTPNHGSDDLTFNYQLTTDPGDPAGFAIKVVSASYENSTFTAPDEIFFDVEDDNWTPTTFGKDLRPTGSPNWVSPSFTWGESDGVGGVSYPTVDFLYTEGAGPPNDLIATFVHTDGQRCEARWSLGMAYAIDQGGAPDYTTNARWDFDDCAGALPPTAHLLVEVDWYEDYNRQYLAPTRLKITNNSTARVTFPAGTTTTPAGFAYQYAVGSVYLSSFAYNGAQYSILAPGQSKTIPINNGGDWNRMSNTFVPDSPAPSVIPGIADNQPRFIAEPRVYTFGGTTTRCSSGELDLYRQVAAP